MNAYQMKSLNEYPQLVLIKIVSFLNVKERLKIKSVSKFFEVFIDKFFPLKSLCIYESGYPYRINWPFDGDEISDQNKIYVKSKAGDCCICLQKKCFKQLEKLYIYNLKNNDRLLRIFDFSSDRLKVLSIHSYLDSSLTCLSFEHLEVLLLKKVFLHPDFLLHAPNLKKLSIWHVPRLRIKLKLTSKKLESLKCEVFSLDCFHCNLAGLKELICVDIKFPLSLEHLPSLESLEVYPTKNYLNIFQLLNEIRESISHKNLNVYVYGFNIRNKDVSTLINSKFHLQAYGFSHKENLWLSNPFFSQVIAMNYSSIVKSCDWPIYLSYEDFTNSFTVLPQNFSKHFPLLRELKIDKKPNHHSLIQFFRNCKSIDTLKLWNDCLNQEFLNNSLPSIVNLSFLSIYDYNQKINFRFVSKLKNLQDIDFLNYFSIDGLEELENCAFFRKLSFMSHTDGGGNFDITRDDCYFLDLPGERRRSSEGVRKLLNYIASNENLKKFVV